MKEPVIGILGGMGPRATVEFEQRLISRFAGNDQAIPMVITINDGSISDRTEFLTKNGVDPIPKMIENAKTLLQLGATVICMPCNTAHAPKIIGRLQGHVPLPFIDMPSAALLQAIEMGATKVLILGTDGTRTAGVFEQRAHTVECIYPNVSEQSLLMHIIARIKRQGVIPAAEISALKELVLTSSADVAILACTELSLLKPQLSGCVILDSIDALATQCHRWIQTSYTTLKGDNHDTRYAHNPRSSVTGRRRPRAVRSVVG